MFKKKKEENLLDDFMLQDNEREVFATVGKYKVFFPNKRFYELLTKQYETYYNEQEVEIDDVSEILEYFKCLTDLPEDFLTIENFRKIVKKPKNLYKKMRDLIQYIITDEMITMYNKGKQIESLPENVQEKYFEKLQEAKDNIEQIEKDKIEYERLKKKLEERKDD